MKSINSIADFQESSLFREPDFGFDFHSILTPEIDEGLIKEKVIKKYYTSLIYERVHQNEENSSLGLGKHLNTNFEPTFIFLKSPRAVQLASLILSEISRILVNGRIRNFNFGLYHLATNRVHKYHGIELWNEIDNLITEHWVQSFIEDIRNSISYNLWVETWPKVNKVIAEYIKTNPDLLHSSTVNDMLDINPLLQPSGYFKPKIEAKYQNELVSLGVFDILLLEGVCIVCELPIRILKNSQNRLHSKNGPAIEWRDGFGLYYWKGINVPKEWIIHPESITQETIMSEQNIEKRHCINEIIGMERYLELMNIISLDTAVDENGNLMKLFRTKERDSTINEFLFLLKVIDPSTKREYYISVPPSYDVHWAKAATFGDKKIQFRQGDVGLLNLEIPFIKPIIET